MVCLIGTMIFQRTLGHGLAVHGLITVKLGSFKDVGYVLKNILSDIKSEYNWFGKFQSCTLSWR